MNRLCLALIATAIAAVPAGAQDRPDGYPNRSIKIVVPFPAGGPSDVLARMIGQKMSEDWGQPVVIENRVGANTVLGAQQVVKAAPDGYTLLMAIDSTLTMNQYLYRTPPYDPFVDFVPITLAAKSMVYMFVNAASNFHSVADVIKAAKAEPGKLNYGAGTITTQLMGYLFDKAAQTKTVLVKYNGSAQVAQGLATKSVDFTLDGSSASMPLVLSGQFRALAKFDARPFPPLPNLADHHRGPAGLRRHRGLARAGCAEGNAGADRRRTGARGRENSGRSRDQGQGGRRRALPCDQHAGRIRRLDPQGGAALVGGREGNRTAIRLRRPGRSISGAAHSNSHACARRDACGNGR